MVGNFIAPLGTSGGQFLVVSSCSGHACSFGFADPPKSCLAIGTSDHQGGLIKATARTIAQQC